jgi:hypothetical protein
MRVDSLLFFERSLQRYHVALLRKKRHWSKLILTLEIARNVWKLHSEWSKILSGEGSLAIIPELNGHKQLLLKEKYRSAKVL